MQCETKKGEANSVGQDADARPAARQRAVRRVLRGSLAIGIALAIAVMIRTLVIEPFHIPSKSMEKSLLEGDAVLVSKLHYGPRLPFTLGLPFTDLYVPDVELPYLRLPGLTSVERGDVVVFNFPEETGPVDRKTHYVKRAVGLPGDWFSIIDKVPYVNGQPVPLEASIQQEWVARVHRDASLTPDSLRAAGARQVSGLLEQAGRITFEASRSIADKVEAWEEVEEVAGLVHGSSASRKANIFPTGSGYSRDNYGPLYVPAAGDTITLTRANWPVYAEVIRRYEGHRAQVLPDGAFRIDGRYTRQYVFEQNYYFALGDNRDNSSDSRAWGFVPEDHLVGKVVMVYFSWNKKREQPRFSRFLLPFG